MKPVTIFSNTRRITTLGILALGVLMQIALTPAKVQEIDTLGYYEQENICD